MNREEIAAEIVRVSERLSLLNGRIRNRVYRSAWDPEILDSLRNEVQETRSRLAALQAELSEHPPDDSRDADAPD